LADLELMRTPGDRRLYALEGVGTLRLKGLASRTAVAEASGGRPASRWRERYALADGDLELAVFDGRGWARRPLKATLEDQAAVDPGLLLFAAFIVRGLAEDAAAGATASTTATSGG